MVLSYECRRCGGMGLVNNRTCPRCGGTGYEPNEEEEVMTRTRGPQNAGRTEVVGVELNLGATDEDAYGYIHLTAPQVHRLMEIGGDDNLGEIATKVIDSGLTAVERRKAAQRQ